MHDIPKEQASLHDRLGGRAAIDAVVGQYLQNVVADDRINGFFANVDAAALPMKLVDQICEASGGPPAIAAATRLPPTKARASPTTISARWWGTWSRPSTISTCPSARRANCWPPLGP
jgi:truncated hemoglobin YjbI